MKIVTILDHDLDAITWATSVVWNVNYILGSYNRIIEKEVILQRKELHEFSSMMVGNKNLSILNPLEESFV